VEAHRRWLSNGWLDLLSYPAFPVNFISPWLTLYVSVSIFDQILLK